MTGVLTSKKNLHTEYLGSADRSDSHPNTGALFKYRPVFCPSDLTKDDEKLSFSLFVSRFNVKQYFEQQTVPRNQNLLI